MKKNNDTVYLESQAKFKLDSELVEDLKYLSSLYNLVNKAYRGLDGTCAPEDSNLINALLIILGRISDFLRCIQIVINIGYPDQAGTLAASIFELAHTAYYFTYNDNAVLKWIQSKRIERMPDLIEKGLTWKTLIDRNFNTAFFREANAKYEYQVYQQLCWMKHSTPMRLGLKIERTSEKIFASIDLGPHTDENALQDARFVIFQTGQYIELVVLIMLNQIPSSEVKNELNILMSTRQKLLSKYRDLYGTENPFEKV